MATAKAKHKAAPAPEPEPVPPMSVKIAGDLLDDARILARITGKTIGQTISDAARPGLAALKAKHGRQWLGNP